MSTLMLLYKGDDGRVFDIPFAYRDGEMMGLAEAVADVIVGLGGVDSLWEAIAADRLRTILEQRRCSAGRHRGGAHSFARGAEEGAQGGSMRQAIGFLVFLMMFSILFGIAGAKL